MQQEANNQARQDIIAVDNMHLTVAHHYPTTQVAGWGSAEAQVRAQLYRVWKPYV